MVFIPKKDSVALNRERLMIGNLTTVPFGTGGWNTKDPLPSMPKQDAVILENMIVENDRIVSRAGYNEAATGFATNVESLFEFANDNSTQIISCASDKIFCLIK